MESIAIQFPVPEAVRPGSYLVVYGDNGTGTIDYDHPLSGMIPARPPFTPDTHWLGGNWLGQPWLTAKPRGHWLSEPWLSGQWLHPLPVVYWRGASLYGPAVHQIVGIFYDAEGRAKDSSPIALEVFINTDPEPPSAMMPQEQRGAAMVFSVTPPAQLS